MATQRCLNGLMKGMVLPNLVPLPLLNRLCSVRFGLLRANRQMVVSSSKDAVDVTSAEV